MVFTARTIYNFFVHTHTHTRYIKNELDPKVQETLGIVLHLLTVFQNVTVQLIIKNLYFPIIADYTVVKEACLGQHEKNNGDEEERLYGCN